ncbi:MAG: two-component regulator propeller domain-containing protein, partial [Candidatus Cloacimonetes bacterium]|nr:two-component regulator propeller domain-containing protein [Candidatus Cloacimonadota bacterium]
MNSFIHRIRVLRTRIISIIVVLLLCYPIVLSQHTINIHSISRRDGLSNGAVNAIAKDKEGYMWFGTWNGLNRFDGNNITSYLPGVNSDAIHNHVIREIYPTASGSIWMLTNKGLSLYDNVYNHFTPFFDAESEFINFENDIAISYSEHNGVFASVYGRGLFKYDSIASQFKKISFNKASQLISRKIKRIHQADSSIYGITADNELIQFSDNHIETLLHLPITDEVKSTSLVKIRNRSHLLIIQAMSPALAVDLNTYKINRIDISGEIITSLSPSRKEGVIWVGTENGRVYSFDLVDQKFENLALYQSFLKNDFISSRILTIYEAEPDVLWIGTDGNGLYTLKLTEFPSTVLSSEKLTYPIVRSILITQNRDILIGTKGGGIDLFDFNRNYIKKISVKNGLSNNSVLSLHQRKNGAIWVGTDGNGVDIISPDYQHISNFPRDFNVPKSFNFKSVYRILETSDGHIFLGTSGYGTISIELDSDKNQYPISFEQLIIDKNVASTEHQKQIVYSLAEEIPGIIWIGTRGFGVYRFDIENQKVIGRFNTSSHPKLINNDDILSLFKDGKGDIWVGSSRGAYVLSPLSLDSVKVKNIEALNSLKNSSIHAIEADNKGNIWMTTNTGLSFIDINKELARNFNEFDGLINFEYTDGASFFDTKLSLLYVGGTQGLDILKTNEIKFNSYFPPIGVNQLYIKNQPIEITSKGILTKRINHQKKLTLKYNQNSLKLDVSPLVFWAHDRHRISYRLKNHDDEWFLNPPNQPINLSNLTPGRYTLQMRVSDENGNWSSEIRELYIKINPPIWITSQAILIYVLILIALQFFIFMAYRRRANRKKEIALQVLQREKEKELQNYKFEFFTNVAHEFRTPLTLITSHIHVLLEDTQSAIDKIRLLKVYKNSVKLQKLVVEIMQFRKLEKGKEPLHIQLTKPAELISEVVSDFELLAQKKDITFEITAPSSELFFKTDADKFQRILSNLVSNAIKYNNVKGTIIIDVDLSANELIVRVRNDGPGIKPQLFNYVFEPFGLSSTDIRKGLPHFESAGLGLAVTKKLVELLKGTIQVESIPNKNTTFICIFPDVHHLPTEELIQILPDESDKFDILDAVEYDKPKEDEKSDPDKPLILLVDDNPEILVMLKELIQKDYNIIFAENGLEAYNKILFHKPDLIVSDIMMPEMDGIELCRLIR